MEVWQISSKELISYAETRAKPKTEGKPRTPYFHLYYTKNKLKYLKSKQKYRAKLKANKPQKPLSEFLIQRQKSFIKCLDKHHITVAIPRQLKTKHPIIKGWNAIQAKIGIEYKHTVCTR